MIRALLSVGLAFTSTAMAQGVLSLGGSYAFGSLRAEFGCPVLPGGGAASDRGTAVFAPGGTFSFAGIEHEVCGGAVSSAAIAEAGTYRVAKDGRLFLDLDPSMPGMDVVSFFVSPDGERFVGTRDGTEPEGLLSIALRLSAGRSNASLSGAYALARIEVDGTASGLAAASGLGAAQFDGAGSYTGSYMRAFVDPAGGTSSAALPLTGTYAVQPDGRLSLGPSFEGALDSSGEVFFAVEHGGAANALLVGVRRGASMTTADVAGAWGVDVLAVLPSAFGEIVTNRIEGRFSATTPTSGDFAFENFEVQTDPATTSVQTIPATVPYTVVGDGSVSIGAPPPVPGVFAADGSALIVGPPAPGEMTLGIGLRLCPARDFGTPTAGTAGIAPQLDLRGGFPRLGNTAFALRLEDGRPGAFAAIAIADAASVGVPFFGGIAWVDPARVFDTQSLLLDGAGQGVLPLPVPAAPALAGLEFFFQGLVLDPAAPGPLSLTAGVGLRLCAP